MPLAIGHLTPTVGEQIAEIQRVLESRATSDTGSTSERYSGSQKGRAQIEKSAGRVGATRGIYDPVLSALLSGEI